MRSLRSRRWHALLIVLMLGFTALNLHVSMHTQADQQSCTLCGGHVNPGHSLSTASIAPIFNSFVVPFARLVSQACPSRSFASYRQRAPPALS